MVGTKRSSHACAGRRQVLTPTGTDAYGPLATSHCQLPLGTPFGVSGPPHGLITVVIAKDIASSAALCTNKNRLTLCNLIGHG